MGKEKAALGHRGPCVKPLAWVYVDTDDIDGDLRSRLFNVWINENKRDGQWISASSLRAKKITRAKISGLELSGLFKISGLNLCL